MERLMANKIGFVLLMSLLSVGCASSPKNPPSDKLTAYERAILEEHRQTEEVIKKAAALSSRALAVYVRTNQALSQPLLNSDQIRQAVFQETHIPSGMEVETSMGWDGAPEPVLARVAAMAGYKLDYINQRPPVSRGITISADKRNLRQFINAIEQLSEGYIESIKVIDMNGQKIISVKYSSF